MIFEKRIICRWLVEHGRAKEAKIVLCKIRRNESDVVKVSSFYILL